VGDSDRFIILVLLYRRAITIDLLSWFYIRGGRHRSIYYLGFTVAVGDSLLSWFYSRGGRHQSFYYLGFTVKVGDSDHFIMLVLEYTRVGDSERMIYYLGCTVEMGHGDRFIILVLQQRWAITIELFS
jgi:hypothetical protein